MGTAFCLACFIPWLASELGSDVDSAHCSSASYRSDIVILACLSMQYLVPGCDIKSLWTSASRSKDAILARILSAFPIRTVGQEQRLAKATARLLTMAQEQADGRQTQADARAAVEAGTATEEQRVMVKAQAKGQAAGAKATKAKAAAAAVAAGKPMRRCNGAACTKIGPEDRMHKHYANGQEKFCGRYRLPL